MASDSDSLSPIPENGKVFDFSEIEREENKRLRNSGLEYISRTGRTVAAKTQTGNFTDLWKFVGQFLAQKSGPLSRFQEMSLICQSVLLISWICNKGQVCI